MLGAADVFKHYFFTDEDRENLVRLGALVLPYADQFGEAFGEYLSSFPDMREAGFAKVTGGGRAEVMKRWLEGLLSGTYDQRYIGRLEHIGLTHVKRDIPIHWVTSSMNFKRSYLLDLMGALVDDPDERATLGRSLAKILDINLDVMLSSYHEEEIKRTFLTERMDSTLIRLAERFAYGLNLVLVLSLVGLATGVVVLFATEVYGLFFVKDLAGGIISALGTLLIIWVIVELVSTEIRYLRGGRFGIEVFVAVALVSIIRELLIRTLAHDASPLLPYLVGAVLVLGVVYYLISRADFRR